MKRVQKILAILLTLLLTVSSAVAFAEGPDEAKMAPGTYTAEVFGYSFIEPVQVSVTVDETSILGIEVETDWTKTRENGPMIDSIIKLMIPRMLENQTVNVDAITGATYTSRAVARAAGLALEDALEAGGSARSEVSRFQTPVEKASGLETIDVDVLVVGMGGSGCAAATSAAEAMAAEGREVSVLAIDKSGKYGGTSANAGEMLAVNPQEFQNEHNNGEDYTDPEILIDQWLACTAGGEKEDLVRTYVANSGETLDWLVSHGFEFNTPLKGLTKDSTCLTRFPYAQRLNMEEGREYVRDIASDGTRTITVTSYFDQLMKVYTDLGGQYMFETEAYELLYDEAAGAVVGVKARSTASDVEYIINARQVIMACGGFGGSREMQEKYSTNEPYPTQGYYRIYGMEQNDGVLMEYAIENLDAGTCNIELTPMVHLKAAPNALSGYEMTEYDAPTGGYVFLGRAPVWSLGGSVQNMALNNNCLWVDTNGNRFCNEASFWDYWKSGPTFYNIWGADEVAGVAENGFTQAQHQQQFTRGNMITGVPVPEIYDLIDQAVAMKIAYKADTLEELAEQLGMPAENLIASVEKYNAACAAGVDEEFGKAEANLVSLGENGPYYAFTVNCLAYCTCGGLDVDTNMQVLRSDGVTPIEGLYAVGIDSIGVLYSNITDYNIPFGGEALGWAFTSGKLAGESAVAALGAAESAAA